MPSNIYDNLDLDRLENYEADNVWYDRIFGGPPPPDIDMSPAEHAERVKEIDAYLKESRKFRRYLLADILNGGTKK